MPRVVAPVPPVVRAPLALPAPANVPRMPAIPPAILAMQRRALPGRSDAPEAEGARLVFVPSPDAARRVSDIVSNVTWAGTAAPIRTAATMPEGYFRVELYTAKGAHVAIPVNDKGEFARAMEVDPNDTSWVTVQDLRYAPNPPEFRHGAAARDFEVGSAVLLERKGKTTARGRDIIHERHRREVLTALRNGWPVPAEVMAEYPGFVALYGPGVTGFVAPGSTTTPETADVIIAHSAETGTTIRTRVDNDRRWNDAIHSLRAGFKWWHEGKRYYRINSRGTPAPTIRLDGLADQLRNAGAQVYVEPVEVVSRDEADAIKRQHLQERSARYAERAEEAREELRQATEARAPMQAPSRAIHRDVLDILQRSTTKGANLYLPNERLDRGLYTRVNEALEALGGVWNRKAKAHVFASGDAAATLANVLETGRYTHDKDLGFFPTPAGLADELADRARITPGMTVLEPSAGEGAIVAALLARGALVTAVEFDERRARTLAQRYPTVKVVHGDFLAMTPQSLGTFDAVVMNPPFSLEGMPQADIEHVEHAMRFLVPRGDLVAITSRGVAFRDNKRATAFREKVEERGMIEDLPDDSFTSSGTGVRTSLVIWTAPERGRQDDEDPKVRELRHKVSHLEHRAKSRTREARMHTPEVRNAIEDQNAWTDALAAMISKRLKGDVGADAVRKSKNTSQNLRVGFAVSYNKRHPTHTILIRYGAVQVGAGNEPVSQFASFGDGMTVEDTYAEIVRRLPKVAAEAKDAPVTDKDVFERSFLDYAKRRLKRDTGATEVHENYRYGAKYRPVQYLILSFGRKRIVRVEFDGFKVSITERIPQQTTGYDRSEEHPIGALDGEGQTLANAYALLLKTVKT